MTDIVAVLSSEPANITIASPGSIQAGVAQPSAVVAQLAVGQGPSGPEGKKGDKGDRGDVGVRFEHQQLSAAGSWTVNHNLGYRPGVSVTTLGGMLMLAEVLHTSANQFIVYFDEPVTGLAICS